MRLVVVVGAALVLAACGSADVSGDRRVVGGVIVTFTVTPGRAEVGGAVRLALRLTNNSGRAEKLTFASGQQYDFWVTDGDKEIWRWSEDRVFTQAIEERTLGPQESLTLAESWTTTTAGELVAHGQLKANGYGRALTGDLIVGE